MAVCNHFEQTQAALLPNEKKAARRAPRAVNARPRERERGGARAKPPAGEGRRAREGEGVAGWRCCLPTGGLFKVGGGFAVAVLLLVDARAQCGLVRPRRRHGLSLSQGQTVRQVERRGGKGDVCGLRL